MEKTRVLILFSPSIISTVFCFYGTELEHLLAKFAPLSDVVERGKETKFEAIKRSQEESETRILGISVLTNQEKVGAASVLGFQGATSSGRRSDSNVEAK